MEGGKKLQCSCAHERISVTDRSLNSKGAFCLDKEMVVLCSGGDSGLLLLFLKENHFDH